MKFHKIHKEGKWIIVLTVLILLVINVLIYIQFPKPIFAVNIIISAFLLIFVTFFFRNPHRVVEIDDGSLILAPADGTVVVIEPTEEHEYFHDTRIQVSIFMSLFNVHANWFPIGGEVKKVVHHDGNHRVAYSPKASLDNERSTIVIETPGKTEILVRQIAGALARRIVTYAKPGKTCHLNEQIGFIKFGSRVDLFLPLDAEIFVELGESTTGNETIIARLNE
jgi:phosphatidylserine decarboxylase